MNQSINSEYSEYKTLSSCPVGEKVEVSGMVFNTRIKKWGGFIIIRKPQGLLQAIFSRDTSKVYDENGAEMDINNLLRESSVRIHGIVKEASIKDASVYYNNIEIEIERIDVLSTPSTSEVIDLNALNNGDEANLPFRLDNRQVTLRNPRDMAIFKTSAVIVRAFAEYLSNHGFTQIFTPKIVSEGAEGGANVFRMDYFGKQVYLAQSPQFYKQICVGAFERVFEIAPAYRAEEHNTSRHLNEYISLDVEMGFIKGQEDVMKLEAELLRYIITEVENKCAHELNLLKSSLPLIPNEIPVYRLSEVHDILWENYSKEMSMDHRGEDDLAPEEEVFICKYALEKFNSDFVFVTHFPTQHRAFYAMNDPADPTVTLSYDLLMRGREITSGGQRIHKEQDYVDKMTQRGMHPELFKFYIDTFKNGMPPHGGFAIGLERIVMGFLGLSNIKEASFFPRDINRVAP